MIPIPLAINSYKARSGLASSERLVNMYAEPNPPQSPFSHTLYNTPGLVEWLDFGNSSPIYGVEKMADNIFVVCGLTVYMVDSSKSITTIGTLPSTPGRVMMTNNGTQVTILTPNGTAFYCTATANSLTEITDADYSDSSSVTSMDGFTIFTNSESTQYQISELFTTESYLALDFDNVLSDASYLVRGISNNLEVWFFKKDITLVYYNSGNGDFPFERKNGIQITKGCAAKHSVSIMDNSFFFLGDDKIVYQTVGYQLKPVSTAAISEKIEGYSRVDDAYSFTYTQEAHKFYVLTFPTAKKTWVYDISTEYWHERESLNSNLEAREWAASDYVNFADTHIVGSNQIGKLYELDLDSYTEDGTAIVSKIVTSTQFDNNNRDSIGSLYLIMDTGVGINTGQGSSPEIMMRTSVDGGKTWSNELWQSLGEQGEYEKEVCWNRVAYGRSLITEFKISDPVKRAISAAYIEPNIGRP